MEYAQIFRYVLKIDRADYRKRFVEPYVQAIADAPGLVRKTWMADFENGLFASFYVWKDKSSMDAVMASPTIASVGAEPFITDLSTTVIPVQEEASALTRG